MNCVIEIIEIVKGEIHGKLAIFMIIFIHHRHGSDDKKRQQANT